MLGDLVRKRERQGGAAAEPDDVDRRVAGFVETGELFVRFAVARAATKPGHAAEHRADGTEPRADPPVVED